LTEDGYIITNYHVIEDADKVYVVLAGEEEEIEATVVGKDSISDIAVLKIGRTGLTPAPLGDSSTVKVGETAIAIGNPLGTLSGTVTQGIVSAINRQITIDGTSWHLHPDRCSINPGNSAVRCSIPPARSSGSTP
jgi:serine protease Do